MAQKKCIEILSNQENTKVIHICLDEIKEITNKIYKDGKEKKFRLIVACIFRNQFNRELYQSYSDFPGTSVMKLSKGKENIRIYCKVEKVLVNGNTIQNITMVKLHDKKVQALSNKEKNILSAIQKNEYEYKKWD